MKLNTRAIKSPQNTKDIRPRLTLSWLATLIRMTNQAVNKRSLVLSQSIDKPAPLTPGSWDIKEKLRGRVSMPALNLIINTSGLKKQEIISKKINFIIVLRKDLLRLCRPK